MRYENIPSIGIYMITNLINGKKYIGQSRNIPTRWMNEKKSRGINQHLFNAIKKYGIDNFQFEAIESCTVELLNVRENFYILYFKTYLPEFGYNKTTGGDNCIMSEETRVKISKSNLGKTMTKETKYKMSQYMKSLSFEERSRRWSVRNKPTDTTKQKISMALIGIKRSKETKRKIGIKNKGKSPSIETRLKMRKSHLGKKQTIEHINKVAAKMRKPIICIETGQVFISIKEAAEILNLSPTWLCTVCKRGTGLVGGFHFRYYEENKELI